MMPWQWNGMEAEGGHFVGWFYRVTCDTSAVPVVTACRVLQHDMVETMIILHRILHLCRPDMMEKLGVLLA